MLDVFTVSFFGHRKMEHMSEVEMNLENIIRELLTHKEYVEFLVGRNGEFDLLAASTVCRMKRDVRADNNALILMLPYSTAELANNQASFEGYYDSIEISETAASGYFKAAIQIRNRGMVDRSDLVICCVTRKGGGAYQSVMYAEKRGKKILNVAVRQWI